MAQSALTVTAPNPTPPTNMAFTGATPPNVPNFTKVNYAEMYGDQDANGNWTGTSLAPGDRKNPNPPPYFDAAAGGVAGMGPGGTLPAFKTNTAALASGTGATSGGTENSYPGTDTAPIDTINQIGAVPASTSVAHEGAGTEIVVQKIAGSGALDYGANVAVPYSGTGGAIAGSTGCWQMVTMSCGPTLTATLADPTKIISPNQLHASSLSPQTNPTLTSIATIASGGGTGACTCTGTNFTRQSVIVSNGISYPTTYTSPTSITCTAAKKATAGTLPVYVITGGVVQTATVNWTFT